MCTCITFKNNDFYFGRNLDLEYQFGEQVVITPRNYVIKFKENPEYTTHYGMIGMATVAGNYPLYAEAANEKGLCMAGLNFPGNACYKEVKRGAVNVASFEIIPWLLGRCATVKEAGKMLENMNITNVSFAEKLPAAPLHWMLADREECIVIEAVEEGVKIYENPWGVLTNNPPFPFYQSYLCNYMNLSSQPAENRFSSGLGLKPYGQGMGGIGLPGDASPASRFVRTAFLKWNSTCPQEEKANLSQFFHILDNVSMVRGSVMTPEGKCDITTYSCCINADQGIYYYKTYENNQIQAVRMAEKDLEGCQLLIYDLNAEQNINWQN